MTENTPRRFNQKAIGLLTNAQSALNRAADALSDGGAPSTITQEGPILRDVAQAEINCALKLIEKCYD